MRYVSFFWRQKTLKRCARNERSTFASEKKRDLAILEKTTVVSARQKIHWQQHNVPICNLTFPFKRVLSEKKTNNKSIHGFHSQYMNKRFKFYRLLYQVAVSVFKTMAPFTLFVREPRINVPCPGTSGHQFKQFSGRPGITPQSTWARYYTTRGISKYMFQMEIQVWLLA